MAKNVKLLLVENVDSLGIVGDVVNVRTGYARNYLLPRSLATTPSDELIAKLSTKREQAQQQMAQLRTQREDTNTKLKGVELELTRSCNDLGVLYGAVTQQEVSALLDKKGFKVTPRDVRISAAIKRVGDYDIHVKLDSDLDSLIKIHVKPDREIHVEKEGEPAAAAATGGRESDDGRQRRRDALSQAIEAALKSSETKGWGAGEKKSEGGESGKDGKHAKGEKGGKKAAKAEDAKAPKAEKAAGKKSDKGEGKKKD